VHWQLDVTLGEDGKRNRKDSSAENLSLLRKILLNTAQLNEPKLSKKNYKENDMELGLLLANACQNHCKIVRLV
jgi:predicted transposase YbfD/YdcC